MHPEKLESAPLKLSVTNLTGFLKLTLQSECSRSRDEISQLPEFSERPCWQHLTHFRQLSWARHISCNVSGRGLEALGFTGSPHGVRAAQFLNSIGPRRQRMDRQGQNFSPPTVWANKCRPAALSPSGLEANVELLPTFASADYATACRNCRRSRYHGRDRELIAIRRRR
jgi:hypothetical protein